MSDEKDLGEELEKLEGLKDKEFKLFGIKMTPTTIGAAFAVLSTVIGMLYGGFLMYQKVEQAIAFVDQQQEYEEKIADYDKRMQIMEAKVEEAIGYARDIKNGLKDDILRIEKQVDRAEARTKEQEEKVRSLIDMANQRFDNKRDELQNNYDQKANALRDTTDMKLKELENRLNQKLQRALDNPLAR
jgi:chromosome segregation ATPase